MKPMACEMEDHTKENSWWAYDAQGIPLRRVCSKCERYLEEEYRPEILSGYNQSDVDEPIDDGDEGFGEL